MPDTIANNKISLKAEKTLAVLSVIALVIALLFPLIIWDALGSGAMHFMRYGNVSVAGSSAGDSKATFFFGLGYTLQHLGSNSFIPGQLFAAQWRVVLGTTEASPLANTLGTCTLVLTVLMFLSLLSMAIVYIADRHTASIGLRKTARILSIVCACLEVVFVIWLGVIEFSMISKINNYSFRIYDFAAYGGIKFLLEIVLNLVLCIFNFCLFFRIKKV